MKKRLLSMLMAVLMIVSLVPAVSAAGTTEYDPADYVVINIKADAAAKQPGIHAVIDKGTAQLVKDEYKITPFVAKYADQCKECTNVKVWQQDETCVNPGLVVYYCGTCGKEIAALGASGHQVLKAAGHTYTVADFKVVVEPTCEEDGWGYVVCNICGEPEFVGANTAANLLTKGKMSDAVYAAAQQDVAALYARFGHDSKNAVVVTEDLYKEGAKTPYAKAAKDPTHIETVQAYGRTNTVCVDKNGSFVKWSEDGVANGTVIVPTGAGWTADTVCPSCGEMIGPGIALDGLNTKHNMKLIKAGYLPENKEVAEDVYENVDGVTDYWYCTDCKAYFGGTVIPYVSFYNYSAAPAIGTTKVYEKESDVYVISGNQMTAATGNAAAKPAKAATCCAEGYTGDTITYTLTGYDDDNNALGVWVVTARGEATKKLAHNYAAVESVAATCTKAGHEYKNVYKCTNVVGVDADGKDDICKETKKDVVFTDKVIPATGHVNVTEKVLVEATCKHGGLNATVCADCGTYVTWTELTTANAGEKPDGAVSEVYAVYNTAAAKCVAAEELANVVEATCTEPGYTGDKVCKWCGDVLAKGEATEALGHTEEAVEAVAATCTEAGLTAGTKCSVCGEVITAQTEVPALGHKFENGACTVCEAADPDYVAPVAPEFTDAKEISEWAGDAVAWAVANDIIKGRTDGSFDPKANVTRADLVVMLWRQAGEPESTAKVEFTDAADIPEYAVKAIAWAVEKGIVSGYEDNSFKPAADVTRAELVKMLYVMVGTKVETAATFSDVVAGEWYVDAINWAAAEKVTSGRTDGTFGVADNATREEAVTFLFNALAK